MQVRGELHAPAALPSDEDPRCTMVNESLGGTVSKQVKH